MLSPRKETILKSIVGQYITKAKPVPSQSIIKECELGISAATVRNEMVQLEYEGYITRPHTSSGSIPLDKGYRQYVESIGDIKLPLTEQMLISHVFHQVEKDLDEWLNLATTLIAQMVQNVALITVPKSEACQFKHLKLVSLQDYLVLVVLVLTGAKVRQQLIVFDHTVTQEELTSIDSKLSSIFSGLTSSDISVKDMKLSSTEQQITDCLVELMDDADSNEYEEPYLDGLHLAFNQPEFANSHQMALTLTELIEQRSLLKSIVPSGLTSGRVQVIIGKENKSDAIHDYSVVLRQYGIPEEASGTIGVIGPTRMPYGRTIATIDYISLLLSTMIARLYGKEIHNKPDKDNNN
jgi:heat-inducible transcriptional repressor